MLRNRRRRSPFVLLSSVIAVGLLIGPVIHVTPVIAAPFQPTAEEPAATAALASGQVRLTRVVGGLSSPLGVVNAGDGSGRLFVLEKRGTVRVVTGTTLQPGTFLDIRGIGGGLTTDGERGLLGLAFHPSFETNRKLFIYYTRGGGDLVIAELTANAARTSASAATAKPLLTIEHSARNNHNGGQLLFGPDGYLYAFTGDGGGGGDPDRNGQNKNSLLGKTLRIAPNLTGGYTNPPGNPYRGAVAGADQIWSIGLRNPWRASFDRANGTLWIADVGQGNWEEINREPANSAGRNYGWPCREGKHPYQGGCSGLTLTDPVTEYGHGNGDCSVTGGYVYRGGVFRDLVGHYVLGDFCSGRLWTLPAGAGSPALRFHRDTSAMITSFGEAESGELYMTDYAGVLYRVVAPPYSDVTDSKFINDIMWLTDKDYTRGCGGDRFCPKGEVRRDQMASFIDRVLKLPATGTDYFDDDDGNKHEGAINRVARAGITVGCEGHRRYCPSGVVTRAQMATFLDRAVGFPATSRDFYTDDTGNKHHGAINRMAAADVTRGCTATTFCPNGSTLREQMAAFLRRAFD